MPEQTAAVGEPRPSIDNRPPWHDQDADMMIARAQGVGYAPYPRGADELADNHPVLIGLYTLAQAGRVMLATSGDGTEAILLPPKLIQTSWQQAGLSSTSQDLINLDHLREHAQWLESSGGDIDLAMWLIGLIQSYSRLMPCAGCGFLRNPEHLTDLSGKSYCNSGCSYWSFAGVRRTKVEVATACYPNAKRDHDSAHWLGSLRCPTDGSITHLSEGEPQTTRNYEGEVIGATCPKCHLKFERPASQVSSTIPAEIEQRLRIGSAPTADIVYKG